MKINCPDVDRYWHQVGVHTMARIGGGHIGAPWPLIVQVAALVGNVDVEASISRYDGTGPTTWLVTLITVDARLIRIGMQFDAEDYDDEQDREAREPAVPAVNESWVRRLSDVSNLSIRKSRLRPATMGGVQRDVVDVGDVTLTFRDGTVVDLGIDQVEMTMYEDRVQDDGFIDVVHQRTGL